MEQVVSFLFKYNAALFSKSQFGFGARPSVLVLILLAALIGALLYFLFGINRVQTRARKLLTRHPEPECPTEYVGTPPAPRTRRFPAVAVGSAMVGS